MTKNYPSFGVLLAKAINACVANKSPNGKYQKVTRTELQNVMLKFWIPESLRLQTGDALESDVLDPAICLCIDFLVGFGLVDPVSSSIKANALSEQYINKTEINYSLMKTLPFYNDYLLFRFCQSIYLGYNDKTCVIDSAFLVEEKEFNTHIYGNIGDPFLNAFIDDITARLEYNRKYKPHESAALKQHTNTDTILEILNHDFQLVRQDAPYAMRVGASQQVSNDNDLFTEDFTKVNNNIIEEVAVVPEVDRLENRVLARIKSLSPTQFEKFSLRLMAEIANADSTDKIEDLIKHHGATGDGGIDGIVKVKNKFDYEHYYVQCKRYTDKTVGRPQVQEFVGAMEGRSPKSGMFITTSSFTKQAWEYITTLRTKKVTLMDGRALVNYMIQNMVGIKELRQEPILEIDDEFFAMFSDE